MKKITILIIISIVIVLGGYFLFQNPRNDKDLKAELKEGLSQEQKETPNTYEIQGMKVEILKEGTGAEAKNGDTVSVHYSGVFENGTKFDSSVDRGVPFSFALGAGQVIQGWDLGVLGMKIGEKRKLTIPYDLAYGEAGYGPIPPKATLMFEVELLGINQ